MAVRHSALFPDPRPGKAQGSERTRLDHRKADGYDTQSLPGLRPYMGTGDGGASRSGRASPDGHRQVPALHVQQVHRADGGGHGPFPRLGIMTRCPHWRRVPPGLADEARARTASGCVDAAVQCQLAASHAGSEHYGFLDETDRGTALRLRWSGADQVSLATRTDCPGTGPLPHGDACCLFAGHPGPHTWEDGHPAEPPTHH